MSKYRKKLILTVENMLKVSYRLVNWPAYNQALIQLGCLRLRLDEQTLQKVITAANIA